MEPNQIKRIQALEDEMKVLKNEVKTVLLDIREQYLNLESPFNGWTSRLGGRVEQSPSLGEEECSALAEGTDNEAEPLPASSDPNGASNQTPGPVFCSPVFRSTDEGDGLGGEAGGCDEDAGAGMGSPVSGAGAGSGVTGFAGRAGGGDMLAGMHRRGKARGNGGENDIDLATIAGLTQWVDQTRQRIGSRRTEAIVEGLYLIGRLPPGIRDFLLKFVELADISEPQRQIATKDYLTVLTQLEGLLGKGSASEMALVSLLSDGKGDGNG